MKITVIASIAALAFASACPQLAMAAQRQAGPSVSSSFARSTAVGGSGAALIGAADGGVMNPSGNSLINTSPSGSTLFPYGTTGTGR